MADTTACWFAKLCEGGRQGRNRAGRRWRPRQSSRKDTSRPTPYTSLRSRADLSTAPAPKRVHRLRVPAPPGIRPRASGRERSPGVPTRISVPKGRQRLHATVGSGVPRRLAHLTRHTIAIAVACAVNGRGSCTLTAPGSPRKAGGQTARSLAAPPLRGWPGAGSPMPLPDGPRPQQAPRPHAWLRSSGRTFPAGPCSA